MAENEKKTLWDSLVETLGVQPDPEAFERHQPPPTELPKVSEEQIQHAPKAAPSDWNALASDLGVSPSEPADRPSGKAAADEASRPAEAAEISEEPFESVPDIPGNSEEQAEFEAVVEDALDQVDEVDEEIPAEDQARTEDLASQPATESAIESETSDAQTEQDESGGMSPEKARSAFDALFSPESRAWGSAMREPGPEENPFGFEVKPSSLAEEEPSPEEATLDAELADVELTEIDDEEAAPPPEKRKKSRRGRRGGKGRKKAKRRGESDSETPASGEDDLLEDSTDKEDDFTLESEDDAADDGSSKRRSGSRSRPAHRNIPPWSEAIGIIVQSNLDQRSSQSKGSSSSKGRGGRGGKRRKNK